VLVRAVVVFMLAVATAACGLVTGLKVEPVKAAWSGKADPEDGVSQGLTINFDELDSASGAYCELFAGSRGGGGAYHLSVLTNPGGSPIASASADGDVDHKWVRFNLAVDYPESIVKGKKLTFKFTRSGSDSMQSHESAAELLDSGAGGPRMA
jgi:hypothetical protein